jgi:hypothetical protein
MTANQPPQDGPLQGEPLPLQPQPRGPPFEGPPPPATNPLALASMIVGIAAIVILPVSGCCCSFLGGVLPVILGGVAAVLGHVALKQVRDSGGTRVSRNMAIAGLAMGYAGIALGLIVTGAWAAFLVYTIQRGQQQGASPFFQFRPLGP